MPKIAVLILYTQGWQDIARIVIPNAQKYADKHGYELLVKKYPEPYLSDFGYKKLEQIRGIFEHGDADIVWSLDLDTLITNHNYKVEDYLKEGSDFFITKDVNGVNGGSFIVRNTKWSMEFMDWLLGKKGEEKMYCEQDAIRAYMEEYPVSPVCVVGHPSFNSYHYSLYPQFENITSEEAGNWYEGNFVLHLPGLGIEQRIEILKNTKIIE